MPPEFPAQLHHELQQPFRGTPAQQLQRINQIVSQLDQQLCALQSYVKQAERSFRARQTAVEDGQQMVARATQQLEHANQLLRAARQRRQPDIQLLEQVAWIHEMRREAGQAQARLQEDFRQEQRRAAWLQGVDVDVHVQRRAAAPAALRAVQAAFADFVWLYFGDAGELALTRIETSARGAPTALATAEACPVCCDPYSPGKFKMALGCGHQFCSRCIAKIRALDNLCPNCRTNIVQDPIRLY